MLDNINTSKMDLNVNFIKSVLSLFSEMQGNGISLVYLGEFNHEITKMFTSMAESDMDRKNEDRYVKKRVYHVMVETLQNMNKHSDEITDTQIGNGLFIIGSKEDIYYVITSNKVARSKVDGLRTAIDEVNAASAEELKKMYMTQIKHGKLSDKGGAGLGLIDIARKTGEQLVYKFLPIDEEFDLFILKVEINGEKIKDEKSK
ncbi:hypothetical protein JKA74_12285 [Marivirga sp. S37H4]|uniref:Uncharacterized protein n=1 Tax=Marivirga aurantiaca TaxID=2802615 RepID=A0A935CC70_9BACT|nr:SiaB family protein kinase [Marivirga aurantiaca]MBK6265813.1 hypothetical protein [Marivirga aurantiaca]